MDPYSYGGIFVQFSSYAIVMTESGGRGSPIDRRSNPALNALSPFEWHTRNATNTAFGDLYSLARRQPPSALMPFPAKLCLRDSEDSRGSYVPLCICTTPELSLRCFVQGHHGLGDELMIWVEILVKECTTPEDKGLP